MLSSPHTTNLKKLLEPHPCKWFEAWLTSDTTVSALKWPCNTSSQLHIKSADNAMLTTPRSSKAEVVKKTTAYLLQASPEDRAVGLIGGQFDCQRLAAQGARVWEGDTAAGAGPEAGRLPAEVVPSCPGRARKSRRRDWGIWSRRILQAPHATVQTTQFHTISVTCCAQPIVKGLDQQTRSNGVSNNDEAAKPRLHSGMTRNCLKLQFSRLYMLQVKGAKGQDHQAGVNDKSVASKVGYGKQHLSQQEQEGFLTLHEMLGTSAY